VGLEDADRRHHQVDRFLLRHGGAAGVRVPHK
jgi:hypothetical protein